MLKFKCWSCKQEFQISLENLHNKISIQCHNCNNPLPKSALSPLRNLGNSYMDLIDSLHYENTYGNSWGISIMGTEDFIHDEKSQYSFDSPSTDDSYWPVRKKSFKPDSDINDSDLPF